MASLKVFVSSTCYDLSQIRVDLSAFMGAMGYTPMLSEFDSFPIDPSLNTIDNCTAAVEKDADIFLLIIGGRYGSQDNSGKSITNLEYLRARAKRIPIYVFVKKEVLSALPLWKDNPDGNFSRVVEDIKVFEFIEEIKKDGRWVSQFETAQDIINAMRHRFTELFFDCLTLQQKINSLQVSSALEFKGAALKTVLEKPKAWEYLLFSELLTAGLRSQSFVRRDLQYGITTQKVLHFATFHELNNWSLTEIQTLKALGPNLVILTSKAFVEATGEPGVDGDPELISYVAARIIETYKIACEWTIQVRFLSVPDECTILVAHLSRFCEDIIQQIEEFETNFKKGLMNALSELESKGGPVELNLNFKINAPGVEEYIKEHDRLLRLNGPTR